MKPSANPSGYRNPSEVGITNYEDIQIVTGDGISIHAWLLLQSNSGDVPTIIFFHGNAGNIGFRLPNALQMYQLGYNVLQVEYRGYGNSDQAKITEGGLKRDAIASLRYLKGRGDINNNKIFLFGRSLGGAVAFSLADYVNKVNSDPSLNSEEKLPAVAGLIVENTFLSIGHMVDTLMPYISPLKSILLRINWNSEEIAPKLSLPIMYISGTSDELVPKSHMSGLYEISRRLNPSTRIYNVKGGTHNDTWIRGGQDYWRKFNSFVVEVLGSANGQQVHIGVHVSESVDGSGDDIDEEPVTSIPIMASGILGMVNDASKKKQ